MYPTIHDSSADNLQTQGFGALSDCISCEVTEELNGGFTLEMQYPLKGLHSEYLITGNIIMAKPSHNQSRQAFRIHQVKKSFANSINVYANHISYDLSGYPVRAAASYNSLANVISAMNGMTWSTGDASFHAFTFGTDMTSSASFSMPAVQSLRSWMGGQDGSILDVYGGEWAYDNFNCYLTSRRGSDTGYRISYGKNLAEYEKQGDYTAYTHVCAYWKKSDVTVYSDLIATNISGSFRVAYYDASSEYENQPSTAQLNSSATAQIGKINFGATTITVTPAQIGNDVIGLGDGVLICYETVFSTRVIKTVWNVLANEYTKLELGTKKTNIAETIKSLTTAPSGEVTGGTGIVPTDYIIEQGFDGVWYWRKWASGICENWCVNYSLGNRAMTGTYGNGFFTAVTNLNFHGPFISAPHVRVTPYPTGGLVGATVYSVSSTSYSFYLWDLLSETRHVYINVYATGFWKTFNPNP